jgi:hypothetical protein
MGRQALERPGDGLALGRGFIYQEFRYVSTIVTAGSASPWKGLGADIDVEMRLP